MSPSRPTTTVISCTTRMKTAVSGRSRPRRCLLDRSVADACVTCTWGCRSGTGNAARPGSREARVRDARPGPAHPHLPPLRHLSGRRPRLRVHAHPTHPHPTPPVAPTTLPESTMPQSTVPDPARELHALPDPADPRATAEAILFEVRRVIVGQDAMLERILVG